MGTTEDTIPNKGCCASAGEIRVDGSGQVDMVKLASSQQQTKCRDSGHGIKFTHESNDSSTPNSDRRWSNRTRGIDGLGIELTNLEKPWDQCPSQHELADKIVYNMFPIVKSHQRRERILLIE